MHRKLYVTAGVGASHRGEAFDADYELRNNGYCESCAGRGLSFRADRMHRMHQAGHYADVEERVLYNNILGAIELSGENFFYRNPLASQKARYPWHGCPCCVGNIPRALLAIKDRQRRLQGPPVAACRQRRLVQLRPRGRPQGEESPAVHLLGQRFRRPSVRHLRGQQEDRQADPREEPSRRVFRRAMPHSGNTHARPEESLRQVPRRARLDGRWNLRPEDPAKPSHTHPLTSTGPRRSLEGPRIAWGVFRSFD